ncbi:hypothetical protein HBB16_20060 [Pseudonocardia sp. MCCB 268]|nr:hypothetical protein [Pseudonocardia cytotoxica]
MLRPGDGTSRVSSARPHRRRRRAHPAAWRFRCRSTGKLLPAGLAPRPEPPIPAARQRPTTSSASSLRIGTRGPTWFRCGRRPGVHRRRSRTRRSSTARRSPTRSSSCAAGSIGGSSASPESPHAPGSRGPTSSVDWADGAGSPGNGRPLPGRSSELLALGGLPTPGRPGTRNVDPPGFITAHPWPRLPAPGRRTTILGNDVLTYSGCSARHARSRPVNQNALIDPPATSTCIAPLAWGDKVLIDLSAGVRGTWAVRSCWWLGWVHTRP